MKRLRTLLLTAAFALSLLLTGCGEKTTLTPKDPVSLTLWHVYGEQADSPMNQLVEDFNVTEGKEKGIVINVTLMSNAAQIGEKLRSAQKGDAGIPEMPDLFFCHKNDAEGLGTENLLNWKDFFTEEELNAYVPEFLEDGLVDDKLLIFPVSKSTQVLCICGSQFDRFSEATGVTYDDLSTWEGFFDAAEKYHEWSGGKVFCALDYPIRAIELNAMEKGGKDFYTEDGWYDLENAALKDSYLEFAHALAAGSIAISDLYSNTQVMTGEVMAGLGSSASILYYNDAVIYPDNTSEPMNLQVLPMPKAAGSDLLVTQAGVGLSAYKSTEQKAEAAAVFARWLTESERNLDFCVSAGYMPVTEEAFSKIDDYEFDSDAYRSLYNTLHIVNETATAIREPAFTGYYGKVSTLYDGLREAQKELPVRHQNGESTDALADELWELFCGIS